MASWFEDAYDRERDNERDREESREETIELEAWDRIRIQRETQEEMS